ncbi:MAG TPA: hypothetical protein VL484_20675 [Vicinamibacterales bacterium]|nr:hypothetical protein [Vicinamibacterales bacterium]
MRRGFTRSGAVGFAVISTLVGAGAVHAAAQAPATGTQDSVCVALVTPSVEGVPGNATEVGVAVRDLFASFLAGPALHAVPLDARLVSQALQEAQQKQCANVLVASVTMKRSGGSSMLKRMAGNTGSNVAWQLPTGGSTVSSAVARGAAITAAQTMSGVASSTRAKDEMLLEYRVMTNGSVRLPPTTKQAKAHVDGEDLLTPLVQQAAEVIAGAVTKSQTP